MKTMTLLAALALVALMSGATPALALDSAQTQEGCPIWCNCATPKPPARRIADAGPTISRIWERSQRPDHIIRILPKGG
jgi:hypothetical protein